MTQIDFEDLSLEDNLFGDQFLESISDCFCNPNGFFVRCQIEGLCLLSFNILTSNFVAGNFYEISRGPQKFLRCPHFGHQCSTLLLSGSGLVGSQYFCRAYLALLAAAIERRNIRNMFLT